MDGADAFKVVLVQEEEIAIVARSVLGEIAGSSSAVASAVTSAISFAVCFAVTLAVVGAVGNTIVGSNNAAITRSVEFFIFLLLRRS